MKNFSSIITKCLLVLCLFPTILFAESYSLVVPSLRDPGPDCLDRYQNGLAGKTTALTTIFDVTQQKFTFDVTLTKCELTNFLANGMWIVVNSGPNPKTHAGSLGIIYLDAHDQVNPLVTIYAYNGGNSPSSFSDGDPSTALGAPDRILSSHPDSSDPSFIEELAVTNLPNGDRRFRLVMDTSQVNLNFLPQFPSPDGDLWEGIAIGQYSADMTAPQMGIWYHPVAELGTAYCPAAVGPVSGTSNASAVPIDGPCSRINENPSSTTYHKAAAGYLKAWEYSMQGWIDGAYISVNTSPKCNVTISGPAYNKTKQCYEMEVGDSITGSFAFTDPEQESFTVDYTTGLPSSALSPLSPANFQGAGNIDLNWAPTVAEHGQNFSVNMTATDTKLAAETCGIDICVKPNLPPTCDIQFNTPDPHSCEGAETRIEFTGSGSADPEGSALQYAFTTDCPNSSLELSGMPPLAGDLLLTDPGLGQSVVGCDVTLTVTDDTGQSSTCALPIQVDPCTIDCLGTPKGGAQLDQCGVCNGDGTSCLDCSGTPNGGTQIDQCGVCGGDGSTCLDCAGTPNGTSVLDQCGVCNGDGMSCLECETVDISSFQFTADASVKSAERTLAQRGLRFTRRLLQKAGIFSKKDKKKILKFLAENHALQTNAWQCAWMPDSEVTSCNTLAQNVCVTVSNASSLDCYFTNADDLAAAATKQLKGYIKRRIRAAKMASGVDPVKAKKFAKKKTKNILNTVLDFIKDGKTSAQQIPVDVLDCSSTS